MVPTVVVDSVPEVVVAVVLRSVEVVLLANVVDSVVVMLIDVVGDFGHGDGCYSGRLCEFCLLLWLIQWK